MSLVKCKDLCVSYGNKEILHNFNFEIIQGEILCLCGQSGSGKTTIGKCLMGLCDNADISGKIIFEGSPIEKSAKIGKDITMIFQNHKSMLNPLMKIGDQIAEVLIVHKKLSKKESKERVIKLMERLGLNKDCYKKYPYEISGGMGQRVGIAMSLIINPKLIIADEPTSGLDSQTKQEFLNLIKALQKEYNISFLFITHEEDVCNKIADRVVYLSPIKRNNSNVMPIGVQGVTVVEIIDGTKRYGSNILFENLHLKIVKGESLGIMGESGVGKTTLAKIIMGLEPLSGGIIKYNGIEIKGKEFSEFRTRWHFIMQDPFTSLNPKQKVKNIILEGLLNYKGDKGKLAVDLISKVGLQTEYLNKFPSQLSGGQRQLVCLARCLAVKPELIIFDESFVSIDNENKTKIINLLIEYKNLYNPTFIFILHNKSLADSLCDRILYL